MRSLHRTTRLTRVVAFLVLAVFLATAGSGSLRSTASTISAGFSLSVDRNSVGVVVGAQAVVAVNVSQEGSFAGPVALSVGGAPGGAVVSIDPNPTLPGIPAVVAVLVGSSTPVGSYPLTIIGTGGGSTQTVTVNLVISLPTGFSMVMTPPSRTVVDGDSTTYNLALSRGLLSGPVQLKLSGLPQYATGTVSPSLVVLPHTATVTVHVATNVVPGTYLLTVKGSGLAGAASASAYLIVVPQTYPDFPIAGTADRVLAPGAPGGAVDLALTNPFNTAMSVTNLMMTVLGTNKVGCDPSNYQVTPYAGPASLAVPAHSTRTLSGLGVPRAQWPQVTMLNLPVNQDACKNATVNLRYAGHGYGY